MAKIEDFFTLTNRIDGVDDKRYQHLDPMIRAIDAMANATYQSIYVIDYLKQGFLHVASNPLFLCGHTAEEVRQMGYRFYIDHVPADEQVMLTEINEVGFKRFNSIPLEERDKCFMSYDFHIVNDGNRYLVNHKITPFALADDGRAWLALCVVSLSPNNTPGHIEFHKKGKPIYWEYNLNNHQWQERATVTLKPQEKQVLILSAQGYTVPQIADKMCRALDTVKTYKRGLFERLGVRSITEALTVATNQGLI
jgi:DNA-binding CsgD family transcriptional regulator